MSDLKRTPLYSEHLKLKGRMVPFGGWEMPVQYSGVIAEHSCVRNAVGVFDVSHMGEFVIKGPKALAYLNRVTTNDVSKLIDGGCQYTMLCYDNGTVVDDLIVSRVNENEFLAVVNASNIDKDFGWMTKQNQELAILQNISNTMSLVAVQGPKSEKLVSGLVDKDLSILKYYHFLFAQMGSIPVRVFRTGYTGEDGFELMVANEHAVAVWQQLFKQGEPLGILPAGLGARDTLRLEVSFSLYGHEISSEINALEANLGWIVKLDKGNFIGREALSQIKQQGTQRKIVGFEMAEPGIGRDGNAILSGSKPIGRVTSGTHGPTLGKAIGLALVEKEFAGLGTTWEIDIRGKRKKAVVVKTPFYKRG